MRIVSLLPSSTEIVDALGAANQLVGRSHECDFPPQVKELPICTEPKFPLTGDSAEINRQVQHVLQNALSVYRIHGDVLEAVQPDVIITQSQCEVCAVSLADVEEAASQLISSQPQVVALEPNSLDDVWADIERVAAALGDGWRGTALVEQLRGRMENIAQEASRLDERPTVACIEWIEPLMAAGNWMPTLVEMAGGENLFGQAGQHSPWLEWEALVEANPEVIVVLPCGYDMETTEREMASLIGRDGWSNLRAVQAGKVFVTDGNQYFNRPGPRLAESLEILAEILHPAHFDFAHEETGWRLFTG